MPSGEHSPSSSASGQFPIIRKRRGDQYWQATEKFPPACSLTLVSPLGREITLLECAGPW